MLLFWLVGWVLTGLAAGWLARKVVPGVRSGGLLVDALTGMVGAVIGGLLSWFLPINLGIPIIGPIFAAFIGAVILLFILKMTGKSRVRY